MLDGQPLFHRGKAHLLTVAPARQGKGINVVIPNLLHYAGSVIVTDPKGELVAVTAKHRKERLGQKVVVFKPVGPARLATGQDQSVARGDPAGQRSAASARPDR